MSKDYLTEKAIFGCTVAPSVMFDCSEKNNDCVEFNGSKVLTTAAKLSPRQGGICPILTAQNQGTPTQCAGSFSAWLRFSLTEKIKDKAMLTQDSMMMCSRCPGAQVKLKMP